MSTHYGWRTHWGDYDVTVTADWSQASCPVSGLDGGQQVADFCHRPKAALRRALEESARAEGMDVDRESRRGGAISRAMAAAWRVSPRVEAES